MNAQSPEPRESGLFRNFTADSKPGVMESITVRDFNSNISRRYNAKCIKMQYFVSVYIYIYVIRKTYIVNTCKSLHWSKKNGSSLSLRRNSVSHFAVSPTTTTYNDTQQRSVHPNAQHWSRYVDMSRKIVKITCITIQYHSYSHALPLTGVGSLSSSCTVVFEDFPGMFLRAAPGTKNARRLKKDFNQSFNSVFKDDGCLYLKYIFVLWNDLSTSYDGCIAMKSSQLHYIKTIQQIQSQQKSKTRYTNLHHTSSYRVVLRLCSSFGFHWQFSDFHWLPTWLYSPELSAWFSLFWSLCSLAWQKLCHKRTIPLPPRVGSTKRPTRQAALLWLTCPF